MTTFTYLFGSEVVDREDDPVSVRTHQLRQGAALLLVVGQPLQEAVLVDLSNKKWTHGNPMRRGMTHAHRVV